MACIAALPATTYAAAGYTGDQETANDHRTISATGEAEIRVLPDRVILMLGVETLDADLAKAKKDNDDRVKRILAIARAAGVDGTSIQADRISIQPQWDKGAGGHRELLGYQVRKGIALTLNDLSRFETLLGSVLEAGVNSVNGVQFFTTKLREHRDRARAMAITAAREKAVALAKELGMKVGRPRSIEETGSGWMSSYSAWDEGRYARMSNSLQTVGSAPTELGEASALGFISITSGVSVTFDLE